ncbi:MAG: hypothetical protein HUJ61_08600, partial [Bacilli bacterium]|nr:hypothetical protein [Bacilli bacterium]
MRKRKLYKDIVENVKLPRSRKELFSTIFKDDFFLIPLFGMFLLFFGLPLFALIGIQYFMVVSLSEITLETIFPIAFYGGLFGIPCFMIAYLARYAVYHVIKKRAFNDGFILTPTLFEGIKENWLKALLSGLVMGLSSMALQVGGV